MKRSRILPEAFRGLKAAEVRADGDTPKTISGYGAVFYNSTDAGTEYRIWNDYYERIIPGAFDRALKEDDVRSMFNHDPNQLLGRRAFRDDDTLTLSVDSTGLRYEVRVDMDDPTHQSLVPKLRAGKVDGASFMFEITKRAWMEEERGDGDNKRTVDVLEIQEVRLWEVGPVVFPAYESATSGLRSREQSAVLEELEERRRKRGQPEDALRLFRMRVGIDSLLRHRA